MQRKIKSAALAAVFILTAGTVTMIHGASRSQAQSMINNATALYNQLRGKQHTGNARIHFDAGVRSLNSAKRYLNRRAYNTAHSSALAAVSHFNKVKGVTTAGPASTAPTGSVEQKIAAAKQRLAQLKRVRRLSWRGRIGLKNAEKHIRAAEDALRRALAEIERAHNYLKQIR